ncbi:MAG: hypothetical protein FJ264_03445 [Planctomycetes bacterium]|nr:hypothetical protein [Planctomycetota bacterium]
MDDNSLRINSKDAAVAYQDFKKNIQTEMQEKKQKEIQETKERSRDEAYKRDIQRERDAVELAKKEDIKKNALKEMEEDEYIEDTNKAFEELQATKELISKKSSSAVFAQANITSQKVLAFHER